MGQPPPAILERRGRLSYIFEGNLMHTEMLILKFTKAVVDQPIIYRLVKDYDLEFNLLKATI